MATTPNRPDLTRPVKRGRAASAASPAAVEEVPVWLEVNRVPAVTWMCTPDLLEELAIGWLHGEGFIAALDEVHLRPCATDLGFWAEVPGERVAAVTAEGRRPVLASGCGSVTTYLAAPESVPTAPPRVPAPDLAALRRLFKAMFQRGIRYRDTGGIHAAALTDGVELVSHAEDIGRHNAVDKVVGAALLGQRPLAGLGLLVTGRISAELAYKAVRAELGYVATPSVPSTLALEIGRRAGLLIIGRAVSGTPQLHGMEG